MSYEPLVDSFVEGESESDEGSGASSIFEDEERKAFEAKRRQVQKERKDFDEEMRQLGLLDKGQRLSQREAELAAEVREMEEKDVQRRRIEGEIVRVWGMTTDYNEMEFKDVLVKKEMVKIEGKYKKKEVAFERINKYLWIWEPASKVEGRSDEDSWDTLSFLRDCYNRKKSAKKPRDLRRSLLARSVPSTRPASLSCT